MNRLGPDGERLIKGDERCELRAYDDGFGNWTIGYGHTDRAGAPQVYPGMEITQAQADAIFQNDVAPCVRNAEKVAEMAPDGLTQKQKDALSSFDFNTGHLMRSRIPALVRAGRSAEVPAEMMKYVHSNGRRVLGLVNRRKHEIALWCSVDGVATDHADDPADVDVDFARAKGMHKSKIGNSAVFLGAGGAAATVTQAGNALQQAQDTMEQAQNMVQQTQDIAGSVVTLGSLAHLFTPGVMLGVVATAVCVAVWFWRHDHMVKDGI